MWSTPAVMTGLEPLPADLAAAHAMILAERAARLAAEAEMFDARFEIERLKLLLAKARREQYGRSSERGAKLNGIDPQAWLADVLARLPDHPAKRVGELLPWNWTTPATAAAAA